MGNTPRTLLIVCNLIDKLALIKEFQLAQLSSGYHVTYAETGEAAIQTVVDGTTHIDCVVIDSRLADMTVHDFLGSFSRSGTSLLPVIVILRNQDSGTANSFIRAGAQDALDSASLSAEILASAIEKAIERVGFADRVKQQEAIRRETEERLTLALAASGGAAWDWDFVNDVAWWSDEMYPLFGIPHGTPVRLEDFFALLHDDDLQLQRDEVDRVIRQGKNYDCEYRIIHSTLGERWMHARGRVVFDSSGRAARLQGVTLDITEQKNAQGRLRLNEERLRLATEFAEVGFWDVDLINDVLIWPPIVKAMFGISAHVPVTMDDFYRGVHPDDLQATTIAFAAAFDPSQRALYDVEYRTIGKEDGVVRWVAAKGKGVFDETGRCVRVIGTAVDISGRKEAQLRLRDSESRLRVLTDNARVGLVVVDTDHRYRFINQAYADILGLPSVELVGERVADVLATMYETHIRPRLDRAFAGETVAFELVMPAAPSKAERHYSVTYQPAQEAEGLPVVIVVIYDVTELKTAEAALRESEAALRAFAHSTPNLTWMSHADGSVYWYNQRWYDYTGTTFEEMEGMGWESVHDPAVLPEVKARIQQCAAAGVEFEMTFPIKGRDGIFRPFLTRAVPVKDHDGNVIRWIGSNTDVSPERAIQAELEASQAKLREADRRKDTFLATLAHELRNPLAPIRSAAAILAFPTLTSEQLASAQQVIQRQVTHMALLLDDLLDVARITQDKLELNKEAVPLSSIVDSAVEAVRPLLERKKHHFHVSIDTGEPVLIDGDALRLSQVLSNLLTNAAKYTEPAGDISLSAHIENGWLNLTVADNGIGIPSDALAGIFTMFAQVERGKAHSEGGLGIGLALAKGLVEMHGGTMSVHSDGLGLGSRFTCLLPVLPCNPTVELPPNEIPATTTVRRVLIADDNEDAANTLAMLVELAGHTVRVVYGGESALNAARTFDADIAFLDVGMPDLNGCVVAERLRSEPWGQRVYLVALTGWGNDEDRARTAAAGFDQHLTKPIDTATILGLLANPNS